MRDLLGRAYARVGTVSVGDILEADDDFTCIPKGMKRRKVFKDLEGGLFINCRHGRHYLDGQIERRKTEPAFYMGLYPVKES